MNIEIESVLVLTRNQNVIKTLFVSLIDTIIFAQSENELRHGLTFIKGLDKYFDFGFGRNHFWVHQKINKTVCKDRLLIVRF